MMETVFHDWKEMIGFHSSLYVWLTSPGHTMGVGGLMSCVKEDGDDAMKTGASTSCLDGGCVSCLALGGRGCTTSSTFCKGAFGKALPIYIKERP